MLDTPPSLQLGIDLRSGGSYARSAIGRDIWYFAGFKYLQRQQDQERFSSRPIPGFDCLSRLDYDSSWRRSAWRKATESVCRSATAFEAQVRFDRSASAFVGLRRTFWTWTVKARSSGHTRDGTRYLGSLLFCVAIRLEQVELAREPSCRGRSLSKARGKGLAGEDTSTKRVR